MKHKIQLTATVIASIVSMYTGTAVHAEPIKMFNFGGWTWNAQKTVRAGEGNKIQTLEELSASKIKETTKNEVAVDASNIRAEAIKEAAASTGAQGGLAWILEKKASLTQSRTAELDRMFDFTKLALSVPINGGQPLTEPNLKANGEYVMILPPVLLKGLDEDYFPNEDTAILSDEGYLLEKGERLVPIDKTTKKPVFPNWRDYLTFSFKEVQMPHASVLPKTEEENAIWDAWVKKGWESGVEQGEQLFSNGWARLNKDYKGMLESREAYATGKLTRTRIGGMNLGVTGGGKEMRVNQRVIQITDKGSLVPNPEKWIPLDGK